MLTLYFLISKHYALLNMFEAPGTHYPGLAILNIAGNLDDVRFVEDSVVEPFGVPTGSEGLGGAQSIGVGSASENLEGADRIRLTKVWGKARK